MTTPGLQTGPSSEGKERRNKEAEHSRLVDGNSNKQGNLHRRLALGNHKMSRFHTTCQNLKSLDKGLHWGNHVFSQMVATTPYSLKGAAVQMEGLWLWGRWAERTSLLGPSFPVTCSPILSTISSSKNPQGVSKCPDALPGALSTPYATLTYGTDTCTT